jgi:iron complex outermembrane receptor protein
MMLFHRKNLTRLLLCGASLGTMLCAVPAYAQDQAPAPAPANTKAQPKADDAIVVTGSRIAGVAPVGAIVTTLGRDEIENSGKVTLDKMIQELPQVFDLGFSDNSRAQSGGNGNATWSNSINLRGLGPFSTLIITDGHRMTTNGRAINPSVLPTLGVERVEVIADGASAIYGSDAVAGVVNLIPRRNLDGIEAFGRLGSTGSGDFWEWNAGMAAGKVFDRGQVMVAYEHAFRSNLNGADRSFYTADQQPFGGPDYRVNQCSPGTLLYGGQTYALPAQFNAAGANGLQAGTENLCSPLGGQDLFPEQKYDSVSGTATFEIVDGVELLFDGYYNKRHFTRIPGAVTQTFTVPETNAFFVAPSFYVPGSGGYQVAYSFVNDFPPDKYSGFQTNWQVTPGLRVKLPWDWKFEGKIGYGTATDRADSTAGVDRAALAAALASSDPAKAFDPFGLGRTSDATLASIFSADATFPTNAKLTTWQAGLNGPLFMLPGGDVKLAVGYEGQDFTQTRNTGLPNEVTNNRKVNSGYAELYVPLFGSGNARAGFEDLAVTAAVRYDDYSDVGDTVNPKFGINWTPVRGFKLRGSYGTSFRAPPFPEIFGNSTNLYVQLYQSPNGGGSVSGFTLGSGPNPALKPETATTWTAGVDIEPLDGLTLNFTYFDIAYENTISNLLSNLAVLTYADEYAGTDVILFGQAAYDRIIDVRDNGIAGSPPVVVRPFPGTTTACIDAPSPADCIFVDGRSLNLGRSKMQGIDFNIRYTTLIGDADRLTLGLNGTYVTAYKVAFTPGGDFKSLKNRIFNPLTFKARAMASWEHGPLTLRGELTHIGGYDNDIVTPIQKVDSYTLADLSLNWEVTKTFDMGIKSVNLGFEVRNLFNADPPYVNAIQGGNGGGGYDPTVTNPIGREFAISLRSKI